ncbi:MAG: tRNA threonylcarbamoyladenosine dehydratase [Deltaproteobacteria bacterium]|jgi:tRNA A37 threonylcarbamoyladenosine dehydratase|nr:tRNA threonylcarbamoyladenosine dehydratase [Deltaproteobacteria bacterium]
MTRRTISTYSEPDNFQIPQFLANFAAITGKGGVKKLMEAKIALIGTGGVGSWTGEYLARSGAHNIFLFDPDRVHPTNINRQLPASPHTVGEFKVEIMKKRLQWINPQGNFMVYQDFVDGNYLENFHLKFDYIIDAIDHMTAKSSILSWSHSNNIPVVTSLGAGARIDPTQVRSADLADTMRCPLGRDLRRIMRRKYNFPQTGKMGIKAVYSLEQPLQSLDPKFKNGTIAPVTSTFGATLAAITIKDISLP